VMMTGAWPGSPARAATPGLSDPSALEVHEGNLSITTDGAVVEDLEIRGSLRIDANDVVVRNVWVYPKSFWTIYVGSGSASFEHVEIGHPDAVGERGIGGNNVTARYLDIHHVEDGIKIGSNVLYDNVVVHDLDSNRDDPHADAVQADGGQSNAVIMNSSLDSTGPLGNGNAAVILKSDLGTLDDITITNSYLNGGNYIVYVRDGGNGMPTNIEFSNNQIGSDNNYGIVSTDGPFTWGGNSLTSTGELIDVKGEPDPTATSTTPTSAPTAETTTTTAPQATTTTLILDTTSSTSTTTTTDAALVVAADDDGEGGWGSGVALIAAVVFGAVLGATLLWSAQRSSQR
ncbi:MAG: hypothetical protein ACR2NL_08195, partial [Acidimicrobiia bacterium]